jgi:glycosyltransferase involved in cell wall biosynthesis
MTVKVCYVIDTTVGAHWAFEQLRALHDRYGLEVRALVSGRSGSLVDKLRTEGIPFDAWNFSFAGLRGMLTLPFRIVGLARLFRRERFDVIHTHLFRSMIIGRLAAWLADVPVRLTMIAGPYHLETYTMRWIDRLTCWMETTLIASCEYTRQLYLRMGVPAKRLALIYYGPDEKVFDLEQVQPADLRREFGFPAETQLIGMVAYFYPPWRVSGQTPRKLYGRGLKGHEYLIKAVPTILAEFPAAKLLLIGSVFDERGQKYLETLQRLVKRLGLQESVIFTGFRSDVNNILRTLDVSVQPSLNENLGGTIEALLMACPLVATRVGGMIDSVRDGETGVLVEPANADSLAEGILKLLRNPQQARSLGRAGRKLMLERFTLSNTVRDLNELYEKLLRDKRPGRKYRLWVSLLRLMALAPIAAGLSLRLATETLVLRAWDAMRRCRTFDRETVTDSISE